MDKNDEEFDQRKREEEGRINLVAKLNADRGPNNQIVRVTEKNKDGIVEDRF